MPKFYDSVSPELAEWCLKQSIFFTASAPLVGKHVNVSPKGLPSSSFAILGPNQAAYIDATGSGSETISHLYENGRITILFNSFDRSPKIVRFFCTGRVIESDQPEFEKICLKMGSEKSLKGARAVILLDIWKAQTSCGYGVPVLSTAPAEEGNEVKAVFSDRDTLVSWVDNTIQQGKLGSYQIEWNSSSLDGLPGMKSARRANGERLWVGDTKAWIKRVAVSWDTLILGVAVGAIIGVAGSRAYLTGH